MSSIITVQDVKAELPIRPGNTEFDVRIASVIAVAQKQIEVACRRTFSLESYAEIFHVQSGSAEHLDLLNGSNTSGVYLSPVGQPFFLTNGPLSDTPEVKVYYDLTHRFGEDTLLFDDQFTVLKEKACVYVDRPLVRSRDSVKITYSGGYAEVPEDVKFACTMQAVHLFKRSQSENVSTSIEKDDRANEPYSTKAGLLPEAANLVAPYRRIIRGRG